MESSDYRKELDERIECILRSVFSDENLDKYRSSRIYTETDKKEMSIESLYD